MSGKTIKILGRTFDVPSIDVDIEETREQIRISVSAFEKGTAEQEPKWGIIPRPPRKLSPEERIGELSKMIDGYDDMIEQIELHKDRFLDFFCMLAIGVRDCVEEKAAEFAQIEARRLRHLQDASERNDRMLAAQAQELDEQLSRNIRTMGHATLLILRKMEVSREAIRSLAENQHTQEQVLSNLRKSLAANLDMFQLKQRADRLEREVLEMARAAQDFERHMRDMLGPFQELIEQTCVVDGQLHDAVMEIERISLSLEEDLQEMLPPLGRDEQLLEMLIQSSMTRRHIEDTLEQMEGLNGEQEDFDVELATGKATVTDALANIRNLIDLRLEPILHPGEEQSGGDDEGSVPLLAAGEDEVPSVRQPRGDGPATVCEPLPDRPGLTSTMPAFTRVPAGHFLMGSPADEPERGEDELQHGVVLSRSFELSAFPVTQAQWEAVMGYNPSHFKHPGRPVEMVSWFDAVTYCNSLSRLLGLDEAYIMDEVRGSPGEAGFRADVRLHGPDSQGVRLPTEAEWEYACRHGNAVHHGRGCLDEVAWYQLNSSGRTHPVGRKSPNTLGLHDMLGNVWDWVWDRYGPYQADQASDPPGPVEGTDRSNRGGSWCDEAGYCRPACRNYLPPWDRYRTVGFRVCRSTRR